MTEQTKMSADVIADELLRLWDTWDVTMTSDRAAEGYANLIDRLRPDKRLYFQACKLAHVRFTEKARRELTKQMEETLRELAIIEAWDAPPSGEQQ